MGKMSFPLVSYSYLRIMAGVGLEQKALTQVAIFSMNIENEYGQVTWLYMQQVAGTGFRKGGYSYITTLSRRDFASQGRVRC